MSLFFLHPIYLYGLIAASLPLLIHLLNRRRLKRIRFPAVRFVLLSQRRISRSYRLRHWLLLALRTFAVILLVLLLANPIFQTGVGLFAGGGPVSLVVILDNSLSMRWSQDGNGFKQAKEAARLLLSALDEGDRAVVIPTNTSGSEQLRLKAEKEVLLRDLDSVEVASGTADFAAALNHAYELLNAPAPRKEIRLITDLALTGWDQFSIAALKQYDALIPVKIIRTDAQTRPLNGTIREIRLAGEGIGVGLPVNLEATVVNFGDREIKDLLVQLNIDEQSKDQKLVSVPSRGETAVSFQTRLTRPGAHAGRVMLKKDGLAGDPTAHFSLEAQDKLRVLVVDGDPQTSLVQSESFFLTRALNPSGDRDSSVYLPTVIIPEGLDSVALDSYQTVVLCNVAFISDALVARLRNYVRQGGGLLVFSGDRWQAEAINRRFFESSPPLLPAPVRARKLAPEAAAERIAKIDLAHPALKNFSDPILHESLRSTRVWGYFRTATTAGTELISLANGDPLLTEQKSGAGRVLYFATAADRDWSDLPLKTAYLPLMQSLAAYLSGSRRGIMDAGITVGNPKQFSLPPSYVGKNLRITKPDGIQREVTAVAAKDGATASFPDNDDAGIYRVSLPAAGGKEAAVGSIYAVNSPYLESRLDEIGERELRTKLQPIPIEIIPIDAMEKGGTRTDLSLPLLGFLIVTLLFEGWVAQRL